MAISNMYKPGWRSRRRSRLSLIERSVPRLGRVSTEDSRTPPLTFVPSTDPGAEPTQQSEAQDPQRPNEVSEKVPSEEKQETGDIETASAMLIKPSTSPSHDDVDAFNDGEIDESDVDEELELTLSGSIDDIGEEPSSESSESDEEIELGSDVLVAEPDADAGTAEPVESDLPHPPISLASVKMPETFEQVSAESEEPMALPKALEDSWDIESVSAAVQAETESTAFRLDWSSLVESGIVDPRDRGQPLPANLCEIARALVRQALSDQSSWRDRIILVSSARENRSKSMAAINFAFALTTVNHHSVVLLDANMDGSGVGPHLGMPANPGLTTALCDSAFDVDDIALKTDLDRLILVSSGDYEEDILDRFASRRMLEILRVLTEDPDTLLVLDAPPILSSQEAAVLSVIAGQVVLIVEAGTTDKNSIDHALKRIGNRHNVSLVLSHSSGVAEDRPEPPETPASRRLALPRMKEPPTKRLLKKAVASLFLCIGLGLSVIVSTGYVTPDRLIGEVLQQSALMHRHLSVAAYQASEPIIGDAR